MPIGNNVNHGQKITFFENGPDKLQNCLKKIRPAVQKNINKYISQILMQQRERHMGMWKLTRMLEAIAVVLRLPVQTRKENDAVAILRNSGDMDKITGFLKTYHTNVNQNMEKIGKTIIADYENEKQWLTDEDIPMEKKAWVSPDGTIYYGHFENGKLNDENGKIIFPDGMRYQGSVKDNKPQGNGTGVWRDPVIGDQFTYTGQWTEGEATGWGVLERENYCYEGPVLKGLEHTNEEHPEGRIRDHDEKYVGELKNGNLNGHGVLYLSNGAIYDGEFKNGKKHGHGIASGRDGRKYTGEFQNGERNGYGEFLLPSGYLYKGNFKNGKPHNQGALKTPDGNCYQGNWINGEFVFMKENPPDEYFCKINYVLMGDPVHFSNGNAHMDIKTFHELFHVRKYTRNPFNNEELTENDLSGIKKNDALKKEITNWKKDNMINITIDPLSVDKPITFT